MHQSPVMHPAAWTRVETGSIASFSESFTDDEVESLERIVACYRHHLKSNRVESLWVDTDVFKSLQSSISRWQAWLFSGRGALILKGFPLDRFSPRERDLLFWLLGQSLGTPIAQSVKGELLGRVEDEFGEKPGVRGFRTRKELEMHRDRGDLVMLLNVRQPSHGGVSRLASGYAVYNAIVDQAPELLKVLCHGFRWQLSDSIRKGEGGTVTPFRWPVFSRSEGRLTVQFVKSLIVKGARTLGGLLSDKQLAAIECFQNLVASSELCHEFEMEPGDLAIYNNHMILHGRTGFMDPAGEKGRLLLRLWLVSHKSWPLVPVLQGVHHDSWYATHTVAGPDHAFRAIARKAVH